MKIGFFVLVGGSIVLLSYLFFQSPESNTDTSSASTSNNVKMVEGKQVIEIRAKGGYTPRVSTVKAGIPTVVRFNTAGTFDCSAAVSIPSLNIKETLPPSGATEIALGTLQVGSVEGSCGMGMYPFEINVTN
jgi:plastocyanin domain-containing protein